MNKVNGFTTLTITLLLISILVSVSAFIGKVLVTEKRIALNEIEYRVGFAAAEKGVAEAIAELKVNPLATAVSGSVNASAANASYNATIAPTAVAGVQQIDATATLAGGGVTSISVQVGQGDILNPINYGPASPLMVAGKITVQGNFNIVSNPNGAGPGIDVSIWAKEGASLAGSAKTCGQEGTGGGCPKDVESTSKKKGDDIISGAGFPADLVEYLFGMPDTAESWNVIESMATAIVTDCNDPTLINGGAGLYIIDSPTGCNLGSGKQKVGSASAPLVIVVKNGNLTINGETKVYGYIFSYDSDPINAPHYSVSLGGSAKLYGALLINHDGAKTLSGTFDLIYDASVACELSGCLGGSAGAGLSRFGYIPGSWKDW